MKLIPDRIKQFFTSIQWKPVIPWSKDDLVMYLKGAGIFFREIIAPAAVIGTIGFKCHIDGWHAIFFMISALTIYWTVMLKLETAMKARTEAKFIVKPKIHIPEHFDLEEVSDMVAANVSARRSCGIFTPDDPDQTRLMLLQEFVNDYVKLTENLTDDSIDRTPGAFYQRAKRLELHG